MLLSLPYPRQDNRTSTSRGGSKKHLYTNTLLTRSALQAQRKTTSKHHMHTLRLRSTTTNNCCRRKGITKKTRNPTFGGIKKHWNRRAVKKKPQQRLSRSAVWWFTEFCNSHCVSQFAASFIVARAKTSIAESLLFIIDINPIGKKAKRAHFEISNQDVCCPNECSVTNKHPEWENRMHFGRKAKKNA